VGPLAFVGATLGFVDASSWFRGIRTSHLRAIELAGALLAIRCRHGSAASQGGHRNPLRTADRHPRGAHES
jgi:hypothetical protein